MRAAAYITSSCKIATFDEIKNNYDVIIYEGGQGLLLDQSNKDNFLDHRIIDFDHACFSGFFLCIWFV